MEQESKGPTEATGNEQGNDDAQTPYLRSLPGKSNIEAYPHISPDHQIKQRIISQYSSLVIRMYARVRFQIINSRFLETIEQHLPERGHILDLGCGFGLFGNYFATKYPERQVTGVDLDAKRINEAQNCAKRLALPNVDYLVGDANTYQFPKMFNSVVTLDLLHHVDRPSANRLMESVFRNLKPGGVFIVKDIHIIPYWKMLFTYALDKVMDRARSVHYRHANAWRDQLLAIGFQKVFIYYLNDYLPYPHILLLAYK